MEIKKIISWASKRVLLPLGPFFVGASIRYVHDGTVNRSLFDPTELSFSMAMLCLLVSFSINKLDDKDLADSLNGLYGVALLFFFAMFAASSFIKIRLEYHVFEYISLVKDSIANNPQLPQNIIDKINGPLCNDLTSMLLRIQSIVGLMSFVLIPVTVIIKEKYNLDD